MSRKPSVRAKNGHWFSEAGGIGRYFGRVDVVSRAEAMARLWTALAGVVTSGDRVREVGLVAGAANVCVPESPSAKELTPRRRPGREIVLSFAPQTVPKATGTHSPPPPLSTITVVELRDRYLDWLRRHRSPALHREAKRHLQRWCVAYGALDASAITGDHLEAFTESLKAEGHALMYVKKHGTTVRASFNRGVKAGWLPPGFKPFANVESIRLDPRPLLESELPTPEEVGALFTHARTDMGDIIGVYYATGCRTHELAEARCGDFQPNARTLVLGRHKRSKTLREPIPPDDHAQRRSLRHPGEALREADSRCLHLPEPQREALHERIARRPLCHCAEEGGCPLHDHDLLLPPPLDQRDAHGRRGRATRRPHGGNLGGDDRAGLWAFPQPVLPRGSSPARPGSGSTGAMSRRGSPWRALSWIVVGGVWELDSLTVSNSAGERTISLDLGGRLCSFARSSWEEPAAPSPRLDRERAARGL
jgi:integrase